MSITSDHLPVFAEFKINCTTSRVSAFYLRICAESFKSNQIRHAQDPSQHSSDFT